MHYEDTREARETEETRYGMSLRNFWQTPRKVYDRLDIEFRFKVDVAAEQSSRLAPCYFGPDHENPDFRDALKGEAPWSAPYSGREESINVFLNPPYGRDGGGIGAWLGRAYEEVLLTGRDSIAVGAVVCLVPAATDTAWMRFASEKAAEIRFTPRIAFEDPFGRGRSSPTGGSAVIIFAPRPYYCSRAHVSFGFAPWDRP